MLGLAWGGLPGWASWTAKRPLVPHQLPPPFALPAPGPRSLHARAPGLLRVPAGPVSPPDDSGQAIALVPSVQAEPAGGRALQGRQRCAAPARLALVPPRLPGTAAPPAGPRPLAGHLPAAVWGLLGRCLHHQHLGAPGPAGLHRRCAAPPPSCGGGRSGLQPATVSVHQSVLSLCCACVPSLSPPQAS